jgi:hypothetical protein
LAAGDAADIAGSTVTGPIAASAVTGAAGALFNMKDTAVGLLGGGDAALQKSQFRQDIEATNAALTQGSQVNSLVSGISQFATAFIGLGKVLKPLAWGFEGVRTLRGANVVADAALGGLASATGFDPHEHALEDFVKQYPALQGPITDYLAAKPGETAAEGRLRNGIENLVVGGALGAGMSAGAKAAGAALTKIVEAVKLRRIGDMKAANAAVEEAQVALSKTVPKGEAPNAEAQAVPGGGTALGDAAAPVTGDLPTGAATVPASQPLPVAEGEAGAAGRAAGVPGDGLRGGDTGGRPAVPGTDNGGGGTPGAGNLERVGELPRQPAPQPKPALTPEQVDGLIRKAQKDTGAILDAGSYDAAAAEGHAFADTDLIPWQKLASGNERVDAFMSRVVDEQGAYIQKVRGGDANGVMSDAAVNRLVGRLGAVAGEDPAVVRGMLTQAGADAKLMAAKMETAFVLSQKAFQDSYGLVMRINAGNTEGLPLTAATAVAKERMAVAVEMFAAAKAMVAGGARTVRRMQSQFSATQMAQMEGMKKSLASMPTQDFLDIVSSTKGNPQALADKVVPSALSTVLSYGTMIAAANKVWGWSTAAAVAVGGISQMYLRPLAAMVGGHWVAGKAALSGDEALMGAAQAARDQARKELLVTHSMVEDGWQAGKFAFITGRNRLSPDAAERIGMPDMTPLTADWKDVQSVGDIIHNVMESGRVMGEAWQESKLRTVGTAAAGMSTLPFRVHGSMSDIVRVMRYRAIVMAKADQEALEMGLVRPPGSFGWATKEGQDYITHVTGRVRDSFDAEGHALDLDALKEANAATFSNPLIGKGTDQTWGGLSSAGAVMQHIGGEYQAIRFIAPFLQFPVNAFRRAQQLTPGLNMLQKEFINDMTGANGAMAQARATGEMGLGLLLGIKAVQMRLDGRMTGAGPLNPKEASSRRAEGIMPNSLVFKKDDGTAGYFQLNRFEPYQAPLTFWATYAEILMHEDPGKWQAPDAMSRLWDGAAGRAFYAALLTTMHLMKDRTSLSGISQFIDAIQEPNKLGAYLGKQIPGMAVPASSLWRQLSPDPYLREANGVLDGIRSEIPGLSSSLPRRMDWKGDPVETPGKFYNTADDGPLPHAFQENYAITGHYPTPASPTQQGVDLRDLTTESGQSAYERMMELSGHPDLFKKPAGSLANPKQSLEARLEKIVQTDGYKTLTHGKSSEEGTKERVIEEQLVDAHKSGLGMLMAESKTVRDALTARSKQIAQQNMTNAKDLRAVQGKVQAEQLNRLLSPFGMSLPPVTDNVPPQRP